MDKIVKNKKGISEIRSNINSKTKIKVKELFTDSLVIVKY